MADLDLWQFSEVFDQQLQGEKTVPKCPLLGQGSWDPIGMEADESLCRGPVLLDQCSVFLGRSELTMG